MYFFEKLFSIIAKRIYLDDYKFLEKRIILESGRISINESIQSILVKFLISGEDHRFKYHIGFDGIAIFRAFKNRIIHKKVEGASTIQQQLVRVLTNDYERTVKRKFKEIFLATTLTDFVPRSQIPLIYLNIAYYGTEMEGFEQAHKKLNAYLKGDSENFCAELVARIKYPEPKLRSESRLLQIEIRKRHLINLFNKHSSKRIFKIYE